MDNIINIGIPSKGRLRKDVLKIFKNSLIILDTFFPLLARLGSLILLSNLLKISLIDLPAMIDVLSS